MQSVEYAILEFVAIIASMLVAGHYKGISIWKRLLLAGLAIFSGAIGTKLMSFIEYQQISGGSFFGAVFFAPFLMALFALLLRMPVKAVWDLCAPGECAVLSAMKLECLHGGCCYGYLISVLENGREVRFPSQLVESIVAFLTMIFFIWLIRKEVLKDQLYALYMVVYGVERFILNGFRETSDTIMGLPNGQFWSLISFIFGASYLYIRYLRHNAELEKERMKTNRASHKAHR